MRLEKDSNGKGGVSITLCAIGATDTEGAAKVKTQISGINWDPPQYAARAIVVGVNARQREIFHPHHMLFPLTLLYQIVPEVIDFILLQVYG